MARSITASVGVGGFNRPGDVSTVQDLLNLVPAVKGGPSSFINVDGLCFGKSQSAIKRFQRVALGMAAPDGRVDPNGATLQKLHTFERLGSTRFTISRFELRALPNGRTTATADRFYEISPVGSPRRMIYFCSLSTDRISRPLETLATIGGRAGEATTFTTRLVHSIAGFQSAQALDSEVSTNAGNVRIALSLTLPGDALTLILSHQWIIPTSEPGVQSNLRGQLRPVAELG
jgi:hypothetical protein